ncbi:MAG: hypothetical protein ACR2HP_09380, partial [Ilumatobacteraceae bacterium]
MFSNNEAQPLTAAAFAAEGSPARVYADWQLRLAVVQRDNASVPLESVSVRPAGETAQVCGQGT